MLEQIEDLFSIDSQIINFTKPKHLKFSHYCFLCPLKPNLNQPQTSDEALTKLYELMVHIF